MTREKPPKGWWAVYEKGHEDCDDPIIIRNSESEAQAFADFVRWETVIRWLSDNPSYHSN